MKPATRGPGFFGLATLAITIAAAAAGAVATLRRPSLPPPLAAVRCPEHPLFSDDPEITELAGTRLLTVCAPHRPRFGDRAPVEFWETSIGKRPNGVYERFEAVSSPTIYQAQYVLNAHARVEAPPARQPGPYQHEMRVPTPAAFAPTGPETTFWCSTIAVSGGTSGSSTVSSDHACFAQPRSERLHWTLSVHFGEPLPEDFDMRPGVTEAYELVAAHVLEQQ